MKIIDAHSHIENFGSWARFDFDVDRLKDQMSEFDIEKTQLTGEGPSGNEAVISAFQKEPNLIVPVARVNPKSSTVLTGIRRFVEKENAQSNSIHSSMHIAPTTRLSIQ